jgi:TPR repeat protein
VLPISLALLLAVMPSGRLAVWQCPDGAPPPCARPAPIATRIDTGRIAILPFRTTGAAATLQSLRDGMVELLAAEFTGEVGPRAVDPGAVFRVSRRIGGAQSQLDEASALRVARELGAGRALLGAVVGDERRLTITASVITVPGGAVVVRTVRVAGVADSQPALVALLTRQLLGGIAGEAGRVPAADPGTQSSDALRAFLAGMTGFRGGDLVVAAGHLQQALALDPQYARAAYVLGIAQSFGGRSGINGDSAAWALRERLSGNERLLLGARLGPRYPSGSSPAERMDAATRAAAALPDAGDAAYLVGDMYFHYGATLGYADHLQRAEAWLERAAALDTVATVFSHLAETAIRRGDTALARRVIGVLRRRDPGGTFLQGLEWALAHLTGGPLSIPSDPAQRLIQLVNVAQLVPLGWNGVDSVIAAAGRRAETTNQRRTVWTAAAAAAGNRGRRAAQAAFADSVEQSGFQGASSFVRLMGALEDGEEVGGDAAAAQLGTAVLAALAEARAGDAQAPALHRLDSLSRVGALASSAHLWQNLVLARLWQARGDTARALAAVRRRIYNQGAPPWALGASLREEGRLAGVTGDSSGAVRAYRHYLVLRSDPDPALIPQRDSVRAELARLERR